MVGLEGSQSGKTLLVRQLLCSALCSGLDLFVRVCFRRLPTFELKSVTENDRCGSNLLKYSGIRFPRKTQAPRTLPGTLPIAGQSDHLSAIYYLNGFSIFLSPALRADSISGQWCSKAARAPASGNCKVAPKEALISRWADWRDKRNSRLC